MAWKASARKHNERIRRENRAAWYGFYSRLAESHALISREYERRAEALCGEAAEG